MFQYIYYVYLQAEKPYTDPVPSSTKQYQLILTLFYQVPSSANLYWPITIEYQPISLNNSSPHNAQLS